MLKHLAKIWIIGISIILCLSLNPHIEAKEVIFHITEVKAEEIPAPPIPTVHELINHYSSLYGISSRLMEAIVACETAGTYDPLIQSYVIEASGSREDSWGLAQIHLPDHPSVTREQAQNPDFALNFMAKNISEGRAWMWSCYNNMRRG